MQKNTGGTEVNPRLPLPGIRRSHTAGTRVSDAGHSREAGPHTASWDTCAPGDTPQAPTKVPHCCPGAQWGLDPKRGEGLDPTGGCNETQAVLLSPSNLGILLEPAFTDRIDEQQATGSFHIKSQSEPVHFRSAVASAGKSFLNYEILVTCVLFVIGFLFF